MSGQKHVVRFNIIRTCRMFVCTVLTVAKWLKRATGIQSMTFNTHMHRASVSLVQCASNWHDEGHLLLVEYAVRIHTGINVSLKEIILC
jgi:hypothetical protein